MRTFTSFISIGLASILLSACGGPGTRPGSPDLVVTSLEVTGSASVGERNRLEIPVRVVVRNRGTAPAPKFKVSTEFTSPRRGSFVAAFTVPGQSDLWYPHTVRPLAAGADVTFDGNMVFYLFEGDGIDGISLSAVADSCSGDEFMPGYCRVDESNETNNKSSPVSVTTSTLIPTPCPPATRVEGVSDLGSLPTGMSVYWPTPPSTTGDEVLIDSEANFRDRYVNRIDKSRTRFRFSTNINEAIVVENTSDLEIVIDPGFKLRNIELRRPVQRVKISGGEVGRIRARVYDSINDESGYISDVLIDRITLDNSDRALCPGDDAAANECDGVTFQGVHRAAVINSTINSLVYPIAAWTPPTSPSILAQNRDIIIANNHLHSKNGREATVRMHDSVRTVTVHNRLQNGADDSGDGKHNYRIHGFRNDLFPDTSGAQYAYAACNVFVNSGVMIGEGAAEDETGKPVPEYVLHYWFNNNQFYQRASSLYQMHFDRSTGTSNVRDVEIRDNHAYSNLHSCFYLIDCPPDEVPPRLPSDWVIRGNRVEPY